MKSTSQYFELWITVSITRIYPFKSDVYGS